MDTTMELDDLKHAWQALDRRLEQQYALDLHQFRERKQLALRARLRPLATGQAIQIIAGVLLTIVFAPFWVQHRDSLHLMIYGLSLHAYGLMLILFAARTYGLINRIDHAAAVVDIQKRLAELRAWQLRTGLWFAVVGCFIWTPLTLSVFYWLGADVWVHAPQVVYWFIASSFACLGLSYGLLRWSRRPGNEKIRAFLDESSAGRSLGRAQATLDEIARFEND